MLIQSKLTYFFLRMNARSVSCGGHFDLTVCRSRSQNAAVIEQKMESANFKYVKMHDYVR